MSRKRGDKSYMWTKDGLKTVVKLWDSNTTEQIAEKLGVKKNQVGYIATQMRKAGFALPKKMKKGYLYTLIKEVAKELKR